MPQSYRLLAGEEAGRTVAFQALSATTQQSLSDAFQGRGALLLLRTPVPAVGTPRRWMALAAAGFALASSVVGPTLDAPLRLQASQVATLGVGLAAMLAAALMYLRLRRAGAVLPGVYLFARELVDARTPTLGLLPTSQIEAIQPDRKHLTLLFRGGHRYTFPRGDASASDDEAAGDLLRQIAALRDRAEQAAAASDLAALQSLDPFIDERARWADDQVAPSQPSPASSLLLRARPLLALSVALGAALAWPAARAGAALHDRLGIALARERGDTSTLLRFTWKHPGAGVVAAGDQHQKAIDALYDLVASSPDTDLRFTLLRIDDPRRRALDEDIFQKALASGDRRTLQRYASLPTLHAGQVAREHIPRLDLQEAHANTNIRKLWKIAESGAIDEIRKGARAAIVELYDHERAAFRDRTALGTPLAQMVEDALVFLTSHNHAIEASADGHAIGPIAADFERESFRDEFNADARRAMVDALYAHVDSDVFRVRGRADAELKPDPQSPRLQLLYKLKPADAPAGETLVEMTIALMHAERVEPLRVELRFQGPSPAEGEAFFKRLRQVIEEALGDRKGASGGEGR